MAVIECKVFIIGASIRTYAEVYDEDVALVDPTTITNTIFNSGGTQIASGAMTKLSTGKYDHWYNTVATDDIGEWVAIVEVVDGTGATAKTSSAKAEFDMEKRGK